MNVLHLTRDFPPLDTGGLSTAVASWVRAGRAEGIQAAVASFDGYRPSRSAPDVPSRIVAEPFPLLRGEGGIGWPALSSFALAERPRLIHLHDPVLAPMAYALRAALGTPVVFSAHVLHAHAQALRGCPEPVTRSAEAEAFATSRLDLLTAPSPSAAAQLQRDYPNARGPIHILPLCIDPSREPTTRRTLPATILYAGRFSDLKGTREFLTAAREVAARLPSVRFELAGGLPQSPRAERRFVRKHVTQLQTELNERFRFLGWCDTATLRTAYRRAWLFAAPSWTETFGQSVFEALSEGTPVVASRTGAFCDYLEHEREALLVTPQNPRQLAHAIARVLTDDSLRTSLAARASTSAARFTQRDVGRALREIYQRTLQQGDSSPL